jgi:small subunit ribosomal protein S18
MGKNVTKKRPARRTAADAAKKFKKKPCAFCATKAEWIDYKDVELLRRFMSDRAKIRARRVTGNCVQHQREVANAIKLARELALVPYLSRPVSERDRSRGRGGEQRVRAEDVASQPSESDEEAAPEPEEES